MTVQVTKKQIADQGRRQHVRGVVSAPVGVLMAVAGYVVGTYAGLLTAWLMAWAGG